MQLLRTISKTTKHESQVGWYNKNNTTFSTCPALWFPVCPETPANQRKVAYTFQNSINESNENWNQIRYNTIGVGTPVDRVTSEGVSAAESVGKYITAVQAQTEYHRH